MGKAKKKLRTLPRHYLTPEDRLKAARSHGTVGAEERKRRAKTAEDTRRRYAPAHPRHGSRYWFQVSLRLSPVQVKLTANLVRRENKRRRALGLKPDVTMSGLASRWFEQGLARAVAGLAARSSRR